MRKSKAKKFILLVVAFLVALYISLTYISTSSFNVIAFTKSAALVFSKSEEKVFDRNYITSNQKINVCEPNGVGAISHDYSLSLDLSSKNIVSVAIAFDKTKVSVGDIVLKTVTKENIKTFEISNTSISNCSKLLMIGLDSVSEILITSRYDAYGGSKIANEEIVSISSIKINNKEDVSALRHQLLFDFIKSVFVTLVLFVIGFLILKSRLDSLIFKDKFYIEKTFLIATIVIGIIFSFLMPVYQVPDEKTHINIMYEELNWDVNIKTQADITDFADTSRITRNYDEKVNFSTYFNMKAKSPLPSCFELPSLKIIRHLPQAIGFVLTTVMRLPLWVCVSFAEICALLVYAFFGYLTLKIMPFKKEIMSVIMLLPICLQEVSSFSYDSFLLSSYFLLFAYILYVKFTKEKFTLLDVVIILLLTFVVAITKIPYAAILGLVLIIPISKVDFNFGLFRLRGNFIIKHKIIFSIMAAFCLIIGFALAIKIIPYIGESKTFLAAFEAKRAALKIIWSTIKLYFNEWLVQTTGNLGWFDTPVALVFTAFVILNLLFINLFDFNKGICLTKNPFKIFEIVLILVIAVVMSFITILSMYGWTLQAYGLDINAFSVSQMAEYMNIIPSIGGVQGRYFVPVIPLLLIPFYIPTVSNVISKINHRTYFCGYHITVFGYLIIVLLNRYWL